MRFVIMCVVALTASAGLTAQTQRALPHDTAPNHIDTYSGEFTVRTQEIWRGSPGIVVIAEGRQFLFHTETTVPIQSVSGTGMLQYWHDGLLLVFPDARQAFRFTVGDKPKEPKGVLTARGFHLTRVTGTGLVHREGPLPGEGEFTTMEDCGEHCPFYQDPGSGDSGGGGSCTTKSCSVGCSGGSSCSASCGSSQRAFCACSSGSPSLPTCGCSPCD
jgi:hypothetical protein